MSFPGGLAEPGETGLEAAVRETGEEVGLALPSPLGRLSGRVAWHPRARMFAIEPWVFRVDDRPALEPDPTEVAETLWCPWPVVAGGARWKLLWVRGVPVPARIRRFGEHVVWGLTGGILDELAAAVRDGTPP